MKTKCTSFLENIWSIICVLFCSPVCCVYYYILRGNHTKIYESNIEMSTWPGSMSFSSHSCFPNYNPPFNDYVPHAPNNHLPFELLQLVFQLFLLPSPKHPLHKNPSDLSERALPKSSLSFLKGLPFESVCVVFCHHFQNDKLWEQRTDLSGVRENMKRSGKQKRNTVGCWSCSVVWSEWWGHLHWDKIHRTVHCSEMWILKLSVIL